MTQEEIKRDSEDMIKYIRAEEKKRAYRASERGKIKQKKATMKYQQTDAYKEYKRQYYLRRKAQRAEEAKL